MFYYTTRKMGVCNISVQRINIICIFVTKKVQKCVEVYKQFADSKLMVSENWPLWSSGQNSWLQIQTSRVRFPALSDFLRSSGSGTGSTQAREDN
jgi:hypothetical protein